MTNVAVLGAGAFGTSLAKVLADQGNPTKLWARRAEVADTINHAHRNERYLPDSVLPDTLTATTSFADSGLKNDHPYAYTVIPFGSGGDSCFGPASNCAEPGGGDIFADGFESGDTSSWSSTLP